MKIPKKFYGWKMVGLLWLVYLLMQGLVLYGEPVVNSYMILHTGMGRKVLGAGTSLFGLFQGLSGPIVGKAIAKKGIKKTIIFGAIMVAISSVLMGTVVDSAWAYLLAFGVVSGIGIGFSGSFSVQCGITYWFRRKRALAMSIALTGAGIGGFIAGNVLNWIINVTGGDWRMAWHFITCTCLITIIITALFIINRPEDIGQTQDGILTEDDISIKKKKVSKVYKTRTDTKLSEALKDPKLWCIVIALVSLRFTYKICVAHGMLHLLDQGVNQTIAATAIGTMTLLSVAGRLGSGALGDWIEPRVIWVGGMIIYAIGFFNLIVAKTTSQAVLFSICIGIGFGVSYVCSAAMIGNYYGVNTFPQIMGTIFPIQMILGSLAPVTAGFVYDFTQSYLPVFILGFVIIVIGTIAVFLSTPPKIEYSTYNTQQSSSEV